jgi:hypothetical protein
MRVANVGPNSVKFAVGGDSEELTLKVAAGPKMTIQPPVEGAPAQPGLPPAGGNPAALPQPGPGGLNVPAAPVPMSTADRRRAARAAQRRRWPPQWPGHTLNMRAHDSFRSPPQTPTRAAVLALRG